MSNMNQKLFPLPRGDPKKSKTKYKIWAYSLCALRKKLTKTVTKMNKKSERTMKSRKIEDN